MDAEALRAKVSGLETAAGEEESAMAVLRTGVAHNEESLRRLEQELADSDSRRSGIQSQVDGKLARVAEIDRQLYRKYDLTADEIEFIETHVKEMA
jgi:chromosome segregation ATPase